MRHIEWQRESRAAYALSRNDNVCVDINKVPPGSDVDHSAFKMAKDDYQLICGNGVCSLTRWVEKKSSFSDEVIQVLAALITLGLTGCNTETTMERQDVLEFQDVDVKENAPELYGLETPETSLETFLETSPETTAMHDCMDSDGKNYLTVGMVVVDAGTPFQKTMFDVCKDQTILYEQTCQSGDHKKLIVKCSDILPGGICVEYSAGAKCDVASKSLDVDAVDSKMQDVQVAPDIDGAAPLLPDIPEVAPVDYLKKNPLPLGLYLSEMSVKQLPFGTVGVNSCTLSTSFISAQKLSSCLYLKALYDMNGSPIITSSYTDLLQKVAASKYKNITAVLEGNSEYPKLSTGNPVAVYVDAPGDDYCTLWSPGTTVMSSDGAALLVRILEKPNIQSPKSDGCCVVYAAPNGFSSCAK